MDAQISDEIKGHYDSILNYTIDLTYDWWTYRTLFGHSEDRLKLLQEYTSHFFRVVHDALLEKVILGIARLQDPSKSCGRDNHSCEYFVNECEKHGLQNLAALLSDALADARASAKKITQYRHKRVAHRDLSLRHSDSVISNSHRVFLQIDAAVVAAKICLRAANYSGVEHGGASCSRLFPPLHCPRRLDDRKSLRFWRPASFG